MERRRARTIRCYIRTVGWITAKETQAVNGTRAGVRLSQALMLVTKVLTRRMDTMVMAWSMVEKPTSTTTT